MALTDLGIVTRAALQIAVQPFRARGARP